MLCFPTTVLLVIWTSIYLFFIAPISSLSLNFVHISPSFFFIIPYLDPLPSIIYSFIRITKTCHSLLSFDLSLTAKKINVMLLLFLCLSIFQLQWRWPRLQIHGSMSQRSQRDNLIRHRVNLLQWMSQLQDLSFTTGKHFGDDLVFTVKNSIFIVHDISNFFPYPLFFKKG